MRMLKNFFILLFLPMSITTFHTYAVHVSEDEGIEMATITRVHVSDAFSSLSPLDDMHNGGPPVGAGVAAQILIANEAALIQQACSRFAVLSVSEGATWRNDYQWLVDNFDGKIGFTSIVELARLVLHGNKEVLWRQNVDVISRFLTATSSQDIRVQHFTEINIAIQNARGNSAAAAMIVTGTKPGTN